MADGTRLSLRLATVEVAGDALTLAYEVANESAQRVLLVNRLLRRTPQGLRIDPDLVYAHLRPGPLLELSKRLIAIPDDLDVEAPDLPRLTPVAAGERFAETLRIALPVRPHDPYRPQPAADAAVTVDRLAWSLGYVVEDAGLRASEEELAAGGRAWRLDYGELTAHQRIATVETDVAVAAAIDLAAAASA